MLDKIKLFIKGEKINVNLNDEKICELDSNQNIFSTQALVEKMRITKEYKMEFISIKDGLPKNLEIMFEKLELFFNDLISHVNNYKDQNNDRK